MKLIKGLVCAGIGYLLIQKRKKMGTETISNSKKLFTSQEDNFETNYTSDNGKKYRIKIQGEFRTFKI